MICKWFKKKQKSKTKPVEKSVVDGVLVLIIGHGMGSDKGAYGVAPLSMHEHPYNTLVAKDAAAYAKSIGLNCVILNKHGSSTYKIGATASHLVEEHDNKGCVIELHFNAYKGKTSGTETLFDRDEPDNKMFAYFCQKHMVKLFKTTDRGLKDRTKGRGGSNLDSVKVTGCLVEPLFGDNPSDAKLLKEKRTEYAHCLVDAAVEYIEGKTNV